MARCISRLAAATPCRGCIESAMWARNRRSRSSGSIAYIHYIPPDWTQRQQRKELESHYGKKDAKAVETAWPYLSSKDRFLRYAARTVLEFQEPSAWAGRALEEKNPIALTHAMIGLARAGDKQLLPAMLQALERVDWAALSDAQKIDYLRAYQLGFIRMGPPEAAAKQSVGKRLDAFYPDKSREVNAKLGK